MCLKNFYSAERFERCANLSLSGALLATRPLFRHPVKLRLIRADAECDAAAIAYTGLKNPRP